MRFWLHQLYWPLTQNSYFQHINQVIRMEDWHVLYPLSANRLYPFQFPLICLGDFVEKQLFPISNWLNWFFADFIFIWIIQWQRIFRRKDCLKHVWLQISHETGWWDFTRQFSARWNVAKSVANFVSGTLFDGRDVLRDLKRSINYKFYCKLGRVEVKWLPSIQASTASNSDSRQRTQFISITQID